VVDRLEATVETNLKQAAGLRQSILKQAFSGELVPQDPDDEPASVFQLCQHYRGNDEGLAGSLYGFEKQAVVVLVAVKH
jgi:hypothetical protein